MKRRTFLGLAGAAAAFPRVALGQQTRLPRIVYLAPPEIDQRPEAFKQGLSDLGYVDGQTASIQFFRAPSLSDLPMFAAAAVATKPDVIFAVTTQGAQAAIGATGTIPVVFTIVTDPVGSGIVPSLAHPGGNVTGNSLVSRDLISKQVSILKELVPELRQLLVFNVPSEVLAALYADPVTMAAVAFGIETIFVDFVEGKDLAGQFDAVSPAAEQAGLLERWNLLTASGNRDAVFDNLLKTRLPVLSSDVVEGATTPFMGVISYGPNTLGNIRSATSYVAAILKGAKPGDLPIEQPTVFDFAINLDTARKIGITIPPSILAQATMVVDEDWRAPKGAAK